MFRFRSLLAISIAFVAANHASAQLAAYEAFISDLAPSEFLKFDNGLSNVGSVGSVFEVNPVDASGFEANLDGTGDFALQIATSNQGVKTTADVIGPVGSISFLFKVPDFDFDLATGNPSGFSGDRYLFDGGVDEGADNDSFQLRWDESDTTNGPGLDFRIGNTTMHIPTADSNIEATPNTWWYFGGTWDKNRSGDEVQAVVGPLGGSATTHTRNISNGTGSIIGDDGHLYVGNRGLSFARDNWDNNSFRQGIAGPDPTGAIDNFAIWNGRALTAGQLKLQYDVLNGNAPTTFSGPQEDSFDDGSRARDPGGLNWYSTDANSSGAPRPALTVADDSAGIGDGFALFADADGSNRDVQGVFGDGSQASLGANLGDTLTVSFDFRLQELPDPNAIGIADAEVRFGLFEDTDGEFGTNGWGASDGDFDTANPGSLGDAGVYARVGIDTSGFQSGEQTRLIEVVNFADNMGGSSNNGLSLDTVAAAAATEFGIIDDLGTHAFSIELERVAPNDSGESVQMTLTMDDGTSVFTLMGIDADGSTHLPGDGIAADLAAPTVFDYFSIKTTEAIDWVLDNFVVTQSSGGLVCDGDIDGDCQLDDLDAMYLTAGMSGSFDLDGTGTVGEEDIAFWLAAASSTANLANPLGNTYVFGDLDLDGDVDSSDLGDLLVNFNSNAGSAAAGVGWGGGDVTMDGAVDSTDLGELLVRFGHTSSAASAVPEPSSALTMSLLVLFATIGCRRRLRAKA